MWITVGVDGWGEGWVGWFEMIFLDFIFLIYKLEILFFEYNIE